MKAWHAVASYIFRYTLLPFPQPIPVVETRLIALVSQKKFNIEKPAKIRLRKWHFAKFKIDMFVVFLSWLINFAILSGILIFTPSV